MRTTLMLLALALCLVVPVVPAEENAAPVDTTCIDVSPTSTPPAAVYECAGSSKISYLTPSG